HGQRRAHDARTDENDIGRVCDRNRCLHCVSLSSSPPSKSRLSHDESQRRVDTCYQDGQLLPCIELRVRKSAPARLVFEEVWTMPYFSNDDLPLSVRSHLPDHGQDIYREVFNHAWEEYAGDSRREEIAHRVAWAAVKRVYTKLGPEWVLRRSSTALRL